MTCTFRKAYNFLPTGNSSSSYKTYCINSNYRHKVAMFSQVMRTVRDGPLLSRRSHDTRYSQYLCRMFFLNDTAQQQCSTLSSSTELGRNAQGWRRTSMDLEVDIRKLIEATLSFLSSRRDVTLPSWASKRTYVRQRPACGSMANASSRRQPPPSRLPARSLGGRTDQLLSPRRAAVELWSLYRSSGDLSRSDTAQRWPGTETASHHVTWTSQSGCHLSVVSWSEA